MKFMETVSIVYYDKQNGLISEKQVIDKGERDTPFNSEKELKKFCRKWENWEEYSEYWMTFDDFRDARYDIKIAVVFETMDGNFITKMSAWLSDLQDAYVF